ncbi:hypothetical protein EB796_023214 [Bugula neritina]|uniref:Uncharacterized protein n=2 Tax=Bugula neritina TaxID=10212 RepID=A0A7J7IX35_BUGNE|nr:hypothetical protein EB796_023214 [Bugula neritina]
MTSKMTSSTGTSDADANSSIDCSDNPCSPGASSTCSGSSGPVYIRPPGFKHHAQEITRPRIKKKKKLFPVSNTKNSDVTYEIPGSDTFKKKEASTTKQKNTKRDPLPMRLRAFPQSFWQQPNQPVGVSPAVCHKVLPPLAMKDEFDMLRPVTPPDDSSLADSLSMHKDKQTTSNSSTNIKFNPNRVSERKIFVTGNPESLLSKLFESAEEKPTPSKKSERLLPGTSYKTVIPPGSNSMRRGRSKNTISMNKTMLHGSDPYMVDTIAEKMFPHLTLEKAGVKSCHSTAGGSTSIQLITLKEGDKSVTLPSLCVEQNYSQMLSELVPYL